MAPGAGGRLMPQGGELSWGPVRMEGGGGLPHNMEIKLRTCRMRCALGLGHHIQSQGMGEGKKTPQCQARVRFLGDINGTSQESTSDL